MANEDKKDFNAMLHKETGMPKTQIVTDEATIKKYGGMRNSSACLNCYNTISNRLYFKIREYTFE